MTRSGTPRPCAAATTTPATSPARDGDGYLTYVGRTDDVFKASDYRISPFELESVLIEHAAVAEAAVVPSPDPMRLAVPKAYVTLVAGAEPSAETALSILAYARERLAPYKRVRRLEFGELPKTISGKIRRVELREPRPAASARPRPPRRRACAASPSSGRRTSRISRASPDCTFPPRRSRSECILAGSILLADHPA